MEVNVAVATKNGGYVFTSDSERREWTKSKQFLAGEDLNKITRDKSGLYYAATLTEGVFSSQNLGETWKPSSRGLHVRKVWSIAPDPLSDGTVYAGTQYGHLFRTEDYAGTWNEVTGLHNAPGREKWGIDWGYGTTGLTVHTVIPDHGKNGRIYIVVSGNGPYRSDDGGETWKILKNGVLESCPAMESAKQTGKEGKDWEKQLGEHLSGVHSCTHKMVLSRTKTGTIFQQNHCGVYTTGNMGEHWSDISPGNELRHGSPIDIIEGEKTSVFVVPARQDICKKHNTCIQGQLSVYRTDDSGKSWKKLTAGLPSSVHTGVLRDSMAHDEMKRPGLYFGTSTGEVYGSLDLGETWMQLGSGHGRVQGISAFVSA